MRLTPGSGQSCWFTERNGAIRDQTNYILLNLIYKIAHSDWYRCTESRKDRSPRWEKGRCWHLIHLLKKPRDLEIFRIMILIYTCFHINFWNGWEFRHLLKDNSVETGFSIFNIMILKVCCQIEIINNYLFDILKQKSLIFLYVEYVAQKCVFYGRSINFETNRNWRNKLKQINYCITPFFVHRFLGVVRH